MAFGCCRRTHAKTGWLSTTSKAEDIFGISAHTNSASLPLEIYDKEPTKSDQPSVGFAHETEATADSIRRKDGGLKGT